MPADQPVATTTDMREPHQVPERLGDRPVAVPRNSQLLGDFVLAAAVPDERQHRSAADHPFDAVFTATKDHTRPVPGSLRDR